MDLDELLKYINKEIEDYQNFLKNPEGLIFEDYIEIETRIDTLKEIRDKITGKTENEGD